MYAMNLPRRAPVLAPSALAPDRLPGLVVRPQAHGRRALRLDLGPLGTVHVLESPALALTAAEWQCIVAARESYGHMWGGRDALVDVREDPFDGRGAFARCYRTTHYLATVVTPGKPDKLITMRKVAIRPAALDAGAGADPPPLVDDIGFWRVQDRATGRAQPLGTVLQSYLERERGLGPFRSPAHLPIAALSRSGTLPYERNPDRDPDDRNRTAVASALIQVAALAGDTATVLYAGQICEEFRTRAFALHLPGDRRIEVDYTPTARTLGLPADSTAVCLDRENPRIRHLLLSYPGFWLDNPGLARLLGDMLAAGSLQDADLVPAAAEILASPDASRLAAEQAILLARLAGHDALAPAERQAVGRLLARPRLAKYLVGLLHTHAGLARRALAEVPDGPYSITLEPRAYGRSVLGLLRTAQALYTGAPRPGEQAHGGHLPGPAPQEET